MRLLAKFWQNFKIQPDIWFFYGFLLTFTLSVRKVIYFFPIEGNFNEYAGICLYLSDIFLFLAIAFWLLSILRNKQRILSSSITLLLVLLVLWAFISIIWSENHWLALFRSIKILEFYLLFLFISQKLFHACPVGQNCSTPAPLDENVPRGTFSDFTGWNISFLNRSFLIISISGLIQSILGIIQVFLQHSIGLFWLKESLISPEIPGVAKIILDGERYIRAYGLFPHPNILGGFLVFSIIVTIYLLKIVPPASPAGGRGTFITKFLSISLVIQIIGLILTFSKSAILGLVIALAYLVYKKMFRACPPEKCSTWNIFGRVKHFKVKLLAILVFLALIVVIAKPDYYSFFQKSLGERIIYLNVPRGTFVTNPLAGIGQGQFVLEMQKYIPQKLETWQFQPVHNVFLLILSELGLIGLGLFVWFLWKLLIKNVPRGTFYFKSVLLAFIFIMLFDHYLWDIQQGQILLWLTFGLIAGDSKEYIDKS